MERAAGQVTLLQAARTVARGGELDAKLDALAEHVRTAADAQFAIIYLLDPVASVLLPAAQAGVTDDVLASGSIAVDDESQLAAQAVRERRTLSGTPGPEAAATGLGTAWLMLAVPLVASDEAGGEDAEGVLLVALRETPADASGVEDALTALADLCAVAIRNARLQNALLERADWMERVASTDTLTGLANRATLLRMLELEIARATRQGTPVSLVTFEVDDFEGLNERAGGAVADEVLRLVASTLADQVRLVDTVGRLGAAEFGLIAPGPGGAIVARRVQEAARGIEAAGQPVSLSAGSAVSSAEAGSADQLLATAGAALAEAKRRGPGQLAGAV